MGYRTGIGYDLHRTAPDRALVLGGVQIEAPFGLLGHSDADVVLHALCDALLGAAGLGDIGELFPDTDPAFKDADSGRFVAEVLRRVRSAGFALENASIIIHAQKTASGGTQSDDPRQCRQAARPPPNRRRHQRHHQRGLGRHRPRRGNRVLGDGAVRETRHLTPVAHAANP